MNSKHKLLVAGIMLASAAVFFLAALSAEANLLKAAVILGDLVFSGLLLQKILKCEGWYGVLMVRSGNGLGLMKELGEKHPRTARELTEFGLSFAFGIPFSLYAQGKRNWKKVLVHFLLLSTFYWLLQGMPAAASWLNNFALLVGVLFGVAAIGFIAMLSSAAGIFSSKAALSSVAPVVPGITLPFLEGIAAIIIVAIVHEVAHGVLAATEKLHVKSSGVLLFGFLPIGAFVEPDEEKFKKIELWKKRRILVAGSSSNFYFFLVFFGLALAASSMQPLFSQGVLVTDVPANSSAFGLLAPGIVISSLSGQSVRTEAQFYGAGASGKLELEGGKTVPLYSLFVLQVNEGSPAFGVLGKGERIDEFEAQKVYSTKEIQNALAQKNAGDSVTVKTSDGVETKIVLGPDKKMGVTFTLVPAFSVENKAASGFELLLAIVSFLLSVFEITAFLNFALSVVNLLPIFVTDGHRMIFEEIAAALGGGRKNELKAAKITNAMGFVLLFVLLVNLGRWFKFI